ncbi:putative reverse transcriptase domain-containing protein [Tanacetum coccineum]
MEQAPRPSEYVPDPIELEDYVLVYIPETEHPEDLVPAEDEALIKPYNNEVASAPTPPLPPPSLLPILIRPPHTRAAMAQRRATTPSIYHSLLPAETPPLLPIPLPAPSTSRKADIPEADTPPRKRILLIAPTPRVEVMESSAAAARQPGSTMARRVDHSFIDTVDTRVQDTERRTMAVVEVVNLRVSYYADVRRRESLGFYSRHQEAQEDRAAVRAEIEILRRERLAYEQESIETYQAMARSKAYSRALEARIRVTMATVNQGMSVEEIEQIAMINQGVSAALVARDANTNGVDSHNSGTGTEGVVELTQWIEKMETVFRISNCSMENQIMFSTCTLLGNALTWWNSHVRTAGNDIAYAMTWTELKKKITDKYCLSTEIKKLEVELWALKVKGTDVIGYNQHFQELALLCYRIFPEESDKIDKYVGGLPDMIH